LYIGFTDESPIITFKNLKFGFELKEGLNIVKYGFYPFNSAVYEKTDQEFLVSEQIKIDPDKIYNLFL
jgi:hypothetical protein